MRVSPERSVRPCASTALCWLLLGGLCVLPAGCNSSGRQLQADLYQRELRLQEDEIYRLEDCLCEYQGLVRDYRSQVKQLQGELTHNASSTLAAPAPTPRAELPAPTEEAPDAPLLFETPEPPSATVPPGMAPDMAPDLEEAQPFVPSDRQPALDEAPPYSPALEDSAAIDPPGASPRAGVAAASLEASAPPPRLLNLSPERFRRLPEKSSEPSPEPSPEKSIVQRIEIEASVTTDDTTTTPTMLVKLRPIASGEPTAFAGTAAVMLIDPSLAGASRYLARWDFDADEVAFWSDADGVIGLPVGLPGGLDAGAAVGLELWARLIDTSGNKTLAKTEWSGVPLAEPIATRGDENWRPADRDEAVRLATFEQAVRE